MRIVVADNKVENCLPERCSLLYRSAWEQRGADILKEQHSASAVCRDPQLGKLTTKEQAIEKQINTN